MRIIHTSDWHLGRGFHGVGLLDAQAAYLDHLVEVVSCEGVQAVLISGDIYDRALPAPDTVALLDETLQRLVDAGAQVVLSSGNHDSAIRLGFASGLLEQAGVHVRTDVSRIGVPVDLGDAVVYPLPYLEPAVVADDLATDDRTHAGVLRAAMRRVRMDARRRHAPTIVMAHAFVTGATSSDSERDISVGGVAAVPAKTFAGADYAALGHLHGPQEIAAGVRYSGSPVAMSFSEAEQVKSSVLLDATADRIDIETIEAPVTRPLARLRGPLDQLLTDPRLAAAENAWCQVVLTDPARPLGAMERVRARFPHTLVLDFDQPAVDGPADSYRSRVAGRDELDLCCDFLTHVRGGSGASDAERDALRHALESARRDQEARADEGRAAGAA